MSNCGYSALNSIPDAPDINVTNVTIQLDGEASAFVIEHFGLLDSQGGAGLVFSLSQEPVADSSVQVTVNGSVQRPSLDYVVAGQTLTLTAAIESTDSVDVRYLGLVSP